MLVLAACAGPTSIAENSPSRDTELSDPEATQGTTTEPPDPPSEPDPADCEVLVSAPENEMVLFDVEIRCPRFAFPGDGVTIVNDDQRAFVATGYGRREVIFAVDAEGATPIDRVPGYLRTPTGLGLLSDERLAVPGLGGSQSEIVAQLYVYDGDWTTRDLFSTVSGVEIAGFDVLGQRRELWLRVDGTLERRSSANGWEREPTTLDELAATAAFVLDADAAPVEVGLVETGNGWSLRTGTDELASFDADAPPSGVWATRLGGGDTSRAGSSVVLAATDAGLSLYAPSGEEAALPGTATLERPCQAELLECDDVCVENSGGRLSNTVALASTDEGTTWVVHAFAELDAEIGKTFPSECGNVGTCECQPAVFRDESRFELRFSSFDVEEGIDDVLAVEFRGLRYWVGGGHQQLLHMSAGPSRFGVVVRDGNDGVRVLLLQP